MMRFVFAVFIVLISSGPTLCQVNLERGWNAGASIGWSNTNVSDAMLNQYTYSGNTFSNLKLSASHYKARQHFDFQLILNHSKLYPENIHAAYYEYNYLSRGMVDLTISYLRAIAGKANFHISGGICNASFYSQQKEFYNNILYPYGLNERKSYVFSPLNIMPLLSMNYALNKSDLTASFGYAIANISVRPDDNYVKQIGIDNGKNWKGYLPGGFSNFRYSFLYQYNYGKFEISLQYEVLFNSVRGQSDFKSLQRMLLAGITFSI